MQKLKAMLMGTLMPSHSLLKRLTHAGAIRLAALLVSVLIFAAPSTARAEVNNDIKNDARLEGYHGIKPHMDESGTAMCWILLIVLGAVSLGVLFKSPNRTDLP